MTEDVALESEDYRVSGHIPVEESEDFDVYLDGERLEFRDGYEDGVQLQGEHNGRTFNVFCRYRDGFSVSAGVWNSDSEAFWDDPDEDVKFYLDEEYDGWRWKPQADSTVNAVIEWRRLEGSE